MIVPNIKKNKSVTDLIGLVCIDVWEGSEGPSQTWLDNVDRHLDFSQFSSIIAVTYELALDSANDLSQHNTLEVYSWTDYTPSMLLPITKEARQRRTHSWLKEKFSSNSFLILDPQSMINHVNTCAPHITEWFVIGVGWQSCAHTRPLSLTTMLNLPYNFYAAPWSMYSPKFTVTAKDFETDYLSWIDHGNDLYQLQNAFSSSADL